MNTSYVDEVEIANGSVGTTFEDAVPPVTMVHDIVMEYGPKVCVEDPVAVTIIYKDLAPGIPISSTSIL